MLTGTRTYSKLGQGLRKHGCLKEAEFGTPYAYKDCGALRSFSTNGKQLNAPLRTLRVPLYTRLTLVKQSDAATAAKGDSNAMFVRKHTPQLRSVPPARFQKGSSHGIVVEDDPQRFEAVQLGKPFSLACLLSWKPTAQSRLVGADPGLKRTLALSNRAGLSSSGLDAGRVRTVLRRMKPKNEGDPVATAKWEKVNRHRDRYHVISEKVETAQNALSAVTSRARSLSQFVEYLRVFKQVQLGVRVVCLFACSFVCLSLSDWLIGCLCACLFAFVCLCASTRPQCSSMGCERLSETRSSLSWVHGSAIATRCWHV